MMDVAEISAQLAVAYQHPATIVVVQISHGDQDIIRSYGAANTGVPCAPENLIFEIGSITKVFTAILLAHLAESGLVDPDQNIGEICEAFSCAPSWITPRRLATHTSGLPRVHIPLRKLLLSPLPADPYASFARSDLVDWMRSWRPARPPSLNAHAYSNLGAGLLGEVLACNQRQDYEPLLRDLVLAPLGLQDTTISLSAEQQERFAQPHAASGKSVVPWIFQSQGQSCHRSPR